MPSSIEMATVLCGLPPDDFAASQEPLQAISCEVAVALAARKVDQTLPIASITFGYGVWCPPRSYCQMLSPGRAHVVFDVRDSPMDLLIPIVAAEDGSLIALDPEAPSDEYMKMRVTASTS